jgi:SAM-dependent methyltransferase
MPQHEVGEGDAQAFYEDFSLAVGQRDWLQPNLRHEQLKLLIRDLLGPRRGLRIADVGCGAGVMADFLTAYGTVTGIDFSRAAIGAARRYAPVPTFIAGGLEVLPDERFDLICLFDVLEHIPAEERPGFVATLRDHLSDVGLLFCSTPFPTATHHRRKTADPSLQIIDEEVELPTLLSEAADADLQLIRFEAYDVFAGSPEYQAMVFTPRRSFGGPPTLLPPRLAKRRRVVDAEPVRFARRVKLAVRCLRHRDLRTAVWFLRGTAPTVNS